ncbi:hypothetical protein BGZ82_004065 [Podila clonocystis]|nr:hypothetical protein BGZ82_004065 [Podila clonocystis]
MTSHHEYSIATSKPSSTDTLEWDDLTIAQNQVKIEPMSPFGTSLGLAQSSFAPSDQSHTSSTPLPGPGSLPHGSSVLPGSQAQLRSMPHVSSSPLTQMTPHPSSSKARKTMVANPSGLPPLSISTVSVAPQSEVQNFQHRHNYQQDQTQQQHQQQALPGAHSYGLDHLQDFIGGMTKGSGFSNKKPPPLPNSVFHTNTMMALQDGQFMNSQAFTYDQFSGLQQGHPGHVPEHGYQQSQPFMMSRGLSSSSTSSSSSGKMFHSDLNNITLGRHPGGGGLGSASMALAGSGDHGPTDKV